VKVRVKVRVKLSETVGRALRPTSTPRRKR
jgi:hypothetical protein